MFKEYPDRSPAPTDHRRIAIKGNRFPLRGSSPNPASNPRSTLHSDWIVFRCALSRGRTARNDTSGRSTPYSDRFPVPASVRHRSADTLAQGAAAISRLSSCHVGQDLFSCLLPFCYRNTPTQAHPAQYRLLRLLISPVRYMLLGRLSLVNRASLNQRAVDPTPTRPTNFFSIFRNLPLHYVNLVPGSGAKLLKGDNRSRKDRYWPLIAQACAAAEFFNQTPRPLCRTNSNLGGLRSRRVSKLAEAEKEASNSVCAAQVRISNGLRHGPTGRERDSF